MKPLKNLVFLFCLTLFMPLAWGSLGRFNSAVDRQNPFLYPVFVQEVGFVTVPIDINSNVNVIMLIEEPRDIQGYTHEESKALIREVFSLIGKAMEKQVWQEFQGESPDVYYVKLDEKNNCLFNSEQIQLFTNGGGLGPAKRNHGQYDANPYSDLSQKKLVFNGQPYVCISIPKGYQLASFNNGGGGGAKKKAIP